MDHKSFVLHFFSAFVLRFSKEHVTNRTKRNAEETKIEVNELKNNAIEVKVEGGKTESFYRFATFPFLFGLAHSLECAQCVWR